MDIVWINNESIVKSPVGHIFMKVFEQDGKWGYEFKGLRVYRSTRRSYQGFPIQEKVNTENEARQICLATLQEAFDKDIEAKQVKIDELNQIKEQI